MNDKSNELEVAIVAALSGGLAGAEVFRCGDMGVNPDDTPGGVWVEAKGEEPMCRRQKLSVTYYIRTHIDQDPKREWLDDISAALRSAAPEMEFPGLPDAAILPVSSGDYSIDERFQVQTYNQTIHIREV